MERRDWKAAAGLLELSTYIDPYDAHALALLGDTAAQSGNWAAAASALQILIGLNPPDPAKAHYDLARAWLALGRSQEAKREILRALEIAPPMNARRSCSSS